MGTKSLAIILAVIHVVLAVLYSNVTPYREAGYVGGSPSKRYENVKLQQDYGAPDERQHANYVQHLLDGKGLPVFNPKDPNLYETYQSHQPPLFYVLDAGWCKIVGANDLTKKEGVSARYLNAVIGGLTVIGVFFLGRWGLGKEEIGLVAAAFVAFLPMMCALSSSLSNDPLLFCLCTWVMALLTKQVRYGWTPKETILMGGLTGLAILTKTTAVSLLPMLVFGALVPSPNKPRITIPFAGILVAILIAAPWWVRNMSLYGDPLAIQAFNSAFVGSPMTSAMVEAFGAQKFWVEMFGYWSIRSFFGVFGYMDIFLNQTGTSYMGPNDPNALYLILFLATVVFALAGLRALGQKEAAEDKPIHLLNFAFLVIVGMLYLRFNLQYFQAQSRYLYPAIGVIGVGIAYGVVAVFKEKWAYGVALVVIGLGIVDGLAITRLPGEFTLRGTNEAAKDDLISRMSK